MKRKVFIISVVLLLIICLVGCSSPSSEPTQNSASEPTVHKDTPVFELKMQTHFTGEEHERVANVLCELIEKFTHGTVKVTAYPVGTFVPATEMLEGIRSGAFDMIEACESYFASTVPVSEIAGGLPFSFSNSHEAWVFMWHRGFVEILREEYAKQNAYVIPYETWNVGLMTNKPITKMEDLRGMKIRATGGLSYWLTEAGASVVMIPANELYTSLATGVADGGCWADAGPMYEMKFHEVLKNYMLPEPIYGAWNSVFISMDIWNKFTSEQKSAVEAAVIVAGRVIQEQTRAMYGRALNDMVESYGVEVNTLSVEEQKKAREIGIRSWDALASKDPLNAEVISMIKDFIEESKDERFVIPPIEGMPW